MSDKFPRTDTMTCYSYCYCVTCGMRGIDVKSLVINNEDASNLPYLQSEKVITK